MAQLLPLILLRIVVLLGLTLRLESVPVPSCGQGCTAPPSQHGQLSEGGGEWPT